MELVCARGLSGGPRIRRVGESAARLANTPDRPLSGPAAPGG